MNLCKYFWHYLCLLSVFSLQVPARPHDASRAISMSTNSYQGIHILPKLARSITVDSFCLSARICIFRTAADTRTWTVSEGEPRPGPRATEISTRRIYMLTIRVQALWRRRRQISWHVVFQGVQFSIRSAGASRTVPIFH